MVNAPQERAPASLPQKEQVSSVVQPGRAENLMMILSEVNDIVKETQSSGPGEQWSGSGGTIAGTQQTGAAKAMSARDQAIANLPAQQEMQQKLEAHIRQEMKNLHMQAKRVSLSKPGAADHLNELYAKIRKLNRLLVDLLEASVDVIKRIFIRVFIDRQPIL